MGVEPITKLAKFHELINGEQPVVIDFWATWCGPCRFISPIFEKLSEEEFGGKVGFYKVDVDGEAEGDEGAAIAREVNIRAMPTFAVYYKGQKVDELVGANQEGLKALVTKAPTFV